MKFNLIIIDREVFENLKRYNSALLDSRESKNSLIDSYRRLVTSQKGYIESQERLIEVLRLKAAAEKEVISDSTILNQKLTSLVESQRSYIINHLAKSES